MKTGEIFNPRGLFYGALVPNWLLRRKELNFSAKLVWGRLYQYCNDEGRAYPKIETLAEELGSSPSGVRNAIAELEKVGLIHVEDHFATHQASDYYFLWHEWIEEGARPVREPKFSGRGSQSLAGAGAKNWRARELKFSSLKRRESVEENQRRESAPRGGSLRSTASSGPTANAASVETDQGDESTNTGLTNPGAFDAQAEGERLAAKAIADRMQRLGGLVSETKAQTLEAHANKLARRSQRDERRKMQRPVEDLPQLHEKTPLANLFHVWQVEYAKAFPDTPRPKTWSGKEWGQAKILLTKYEPVDVESAIGYTIGNWSMLVNRMWPKGNGPAFPTIALISSFSEKLVPEAALWVQHRGAILEYRNYGEPHIERPDDLMERYMIAAKALESLGVK